MKKPLEIGAYVLVSRWSDADPNDPWAVDYLSEIVTIKGIDFYKIPNNERLWHHCKRITKKKGEKILLEYPLRSKFTTK